MASSFRIFSPEDFGSTGTRDDYTAVQKAYDAAKKSADGKRGGVVTLHRLYNVSRPVKYYVGVSTVGTATWSMDTTWYNNAGLRATSGFTGDTVLQLDADGQMHPAEGRPDLSWHWGRMEKIVVCGAGKTGPHGIDTGWNGEATSVSNVQVINCNSGLVLRSTQASALFEACSAFNCNIGVDADISGSVRFVNLSGDNNRHILRYTGSRAANLTILGLKAENYDVGTGEPPILVKDLLGGSLTILGGWVDTTGAGYSKDTVIRLEQTDKRNPQRPRIVTVGFDASWVYKNIINDTIDGRVVAKPDPSFGILAYNTHILQAGMDTMRQS